jgi:methionyl aminopeptidase
MFTKVKTPAEIEHMRESGRMLAEVLKILDKQIGPGHTTLEADQLAQAELKKLGGKPAFLGYEGFDGAACISVNEEIVHGVPGPRKLKSGDLVSFDFGVDYRGMITDAAFTKVLDASPTNEQKRLLAGTAAALKAGINSVKDGVKVGDISASIERVLIEHKLGILRQFVGHGVGHHVHEEPNIPNYGPAGTGAELKAGMTIALEPMAMLGDEAMKILDDGWTVVTADGSLSAHFEHTVLITKSGAEVLTAY